MTIDFASSTEALGTSAADASIFILSVITGVGGAVMVAAGVLRGLRAIARHFGLGNAKLPAGYDAYARAYPRKANGERMSRAEYRHATAQARRKLKGGSWHGGDGIAF